MKAKGLAQMGLLRKKTSCHGNSTQAVGLFLPFFTHTNSERTKKRGSHPKSWDFGVV